MRTKFFNLSRKAMNSYFGLKSSEKILVGAAAVFMLVILLQYFAGIVQARVFDSKQLLATRKNQLQDVGFILKRYVSLHRYREELQTTYAKSQMTFEEVSNELDRIVRDAIGNDNYEVKKPHPPEPFGFEYEKQEFSLTVRSLSLDQLTKLLYQIEQGEKPIFLSKVDIKKSPSGTDYGASLEIYSISKTAPARTAES